VHAIVAEVRVVGGPRSTVPVRVESVQALAAKAEARISAASLDL